MHSSRTGTRSGTYEGGGAREIKDKGQQASAWGGLATYTVEPVT